MCGICGIVITDRSEKIDQQLLRKMNDSLIHRGPDEEGYFFEAFVGFGHRRLSIIDLREGQQPMYNEDRSMVIVFNGEIYNYQELRDFLIKKGHQFRTASDTEVILHLYEEYSQDCVHKLRGMFAFAIFDLRKQTLFLARDRLGIKPLYYYHHKNMFVFGSEIKAILQYKNINKEIDTTAFFDYLKYLYIPAPKSIFTHIHKLPAGSYLQLEGDKLTVTKYWDLQFTGENNGSERQLTEDMLGILEEAVRLRMISEVPLGAFLSGGIDSSLIVAIMARYKDDPLITNSIGFTFSDFNELPYARETSKLFRTDHHEYTVEASSAGILDKLMWYFDEPFADSSALPTYYVSKMTKENVTVALSGDGGDENFAGYRRYYFDQLENRLRLIIPRTVRSSIIAGMAQIYPKADWLPQFLRAKTMLTNLSTEAAEGYYNTMTHFTDAGLKSIVNPDLLGELDKYSPFDVFRYHYQNAGTDDLLSKTQYVDIKTYLVDDILAKVDRASMANSLEVRVPLLDHIFMEYVAGIPSAMKLRGRNGKYILKKMAGEILPEKILNRKKMGFSIPVDTWFRNELKTVFQDEIIDSNRSFCAQYFNFKVLKKMWGDHQRGVKNYGYQLWSIICFEKWARNFLRSN